MSRTKVRDRKSKVKGWDLLMTTEQTYSGDGVLRAQAEGPEAARVRVQKPWGHLGGGAC